jgi:hypothetical protein
MRSFPGTGRVNGHEHNATTTVPDGIVGGEPGDDATKKGRLEN